MKLTKTAVDHAPVPTGKDQVFIRDTVMQAFALRITAKGVKSFIVEKRIKGRNARKTLGQYPTLTAEDSPH